MRVKTMVLFATMPYYTFQWMERSFANMKEEMPHCFVPAMAMESVLTALDETVREMEGEDVRHSTQA